MSAIDHICPICSRLVEAGHFYAHITSEADQLRPEIIRMIKAYHPHWAASDGVCPACWKAYRDSVQALRLLKNKRQALAYWGAL